MIFLLVPFELLGLPFLDSTMDFFLKVLPMVFTLDKEKILPVPDILGIYRIEVTLGERKIIDGIQQVGFPCAIVPDKAIDLLAEGKLQLVIVLEIYQ